MLGLLLVVVVGILYSLLVSHSVAAAIQLLLVTAVAAYFGRLFLRNLTGSLGTITADAGRRVPDILIARTALDAGRTVGNELAIALKLPYKEQFVPY